MAGLRERKKQATREALSWAALRLAIERGIENVLVEDIANEAGVSPRTFNNYFTSKYEAIVWRELDRMTRIGDELRKRPEDEPLAEAITNAVLAIYDLNTVPDRTWLVGVRNMMTLPALFGEHLKVGAAMERELAAAVADRLGLEEEDTYARIIAGAVCTARAVAQEQWVNADPPIALGPLIREALGYLPRLLGGQQ